MVFLVSNQTDCKLSKLCSKEHRSQLEGATNDQIGNILRLKVSKST